VPDTDTAVVLPRNGAKGMSILLSLG
jgi:hypothetical protein